MPSVPQVYKREKNFWSCCYCMEALPVAVIQTPLDSNGKDISPLTLQTAQIYQIVMVLLLEEHATDPLLMKSINNEVVMYSHDTH